MPTSPCITSLIGNEPKILIVSTGNIRRYQDDLSKPLFYSMAFRMGNIDNWIAPNVRRLFQMY
jgi:hypothetical protein